MASPSDNVPAIGEPQASAAQVAEYLRRNPDFLVANPDLLALGSRHEERFPTGRVLERCLNGRLDLPRG